MLAKKHRLAKDRDIKLVFRQGRGFFNPYFNVKHLKSSFPPRFAIVVSTKVAKQAVRGNRLKRIIRELIKREIKNAKPGDYVIMAKPKAGKEKESVVLDSLKSLFYE